MKIIDVEQGSLAWIAARIGIPTSSAFDRLITPAKGEPSKSQPKYMAKLLAEWYLNVSLDEYVSEFMQRGKEMEASAAAFYEFDTDRTTTQVGFVTDDRGRVGASPDRFVGDDGLLEIKCPSAEVHTDYLLNGGVADTYWCQLQGQLWLCERQWVDILSFHPALPKKVIRVPRDDEFIVKLSIILPIFCDRLDAAKAKYADARAAYRQQKEAALGEDPLSGDGPPIDVDKMFGVPT